MAVGTTWTYKVTTEVTLNGKLTKKPGVTKETDKVISVAPVAGGQKVTVNQNLTTPKPFKPLSIVLLYFIHSDGTITCSQLGRNNQSFAGDLLPQFPPAAIVDSGRPVRQDVPVTIKGTYRPVRDTTHIAIQGEGRATVTVPMGTYHAIIVSETATRSVMGQSFYYKTWLAPGVGPVQQQRVFSLSADLRSSSTVELESFSKG